MRRGAGSGGEGHSHRGRGTGSTTEDDLLRLYGLVVHQLGSPFKVATLGPGPSLSLPPETVDGSRGKPLSRVISGSQVGTLVAARCVH